MQTHIDLKFADGEYRFALGLAQIHELQTKCGIGIGGLYARVLQGRVPDQPEVGHPLYAAYYVDDLVEAIRQGLIGGGEGRVNGETVKVSSTRANELVDRYVLGPDVALGDLWKIAAAVLYAKIEGYKPAVDEANDKKKDDPTTPPPTSETTVS